MAQFRSTVLVYPRRLASNYSMKVLVIASCLLAVASAGIVAPVAPLASSYHAQDLLGQYSYGYNDGPSAKQEVRTADGVTRGGYSYVDSNGIVQSVSYVADPSGFHVAATNLPQAPVAAAPVAYSAPVAVAAAPVAVAAPLVAHNGAPLDTPEVAAAKAAHFAAHVEARARNGNLLHYRKRRSVVGAPLLAHQFQHVPVIGPNGVPLEPAENVAARASHAAAHLEAKARNGDLAVVAPYAAAHVAAPVVAAAAAAPLAYSLPYSGQHGYHLPVIGPNGVPLEPAENVAARANHAAAHIEAKARNGDFAVVAPYAAAHFAGPVVAAAAAPLAYSPAYAGQHGYHLPVIGPNGVPLEPAENVAARANHAAAHIEAKARNGDFAVVAPYAAAHFALPSAHVVAAGPVDTHEVQAAKAAHFAAHAEARARSAGW